MVSESKKQSRRTSDQVRKRAAVQTLESTARSLVVALRKRAVPARDRPGKLQRIPDLVRKKAERLFRLALARACGGKDERQKTVLWRDGDDELLLYVSRARIATNDRLVVTSIPVFTDQCGEGEVVVPFVTSAADEAEGLIAATETRPRGPTAVVDIFGEALVAALWSALIETAAAWAEAAGQKTTGAALAPAGLSATRSALRVRAQVRISREVP